MEEPISAWQPPIAADMVDPFLILPISPATKRNCLIFFAIGFQSPDNTMDDELLRLPLVGAVTILPKAALTSFTDKAKQLTHFRIWRNFTSVSLICSNHVCGSL
jgi:hypothetical protein